MKIKLLIILIALSGCTWKHNNKIVKDSSGNYFLLEASGIRDESYDLKPIDKTQINLIKCDTLNKTE